MSEKPAQPATGHRIWVSPLVKPGQGWRRYFWKVGPSRRGDLAILVLRVRAAGGKSQVRTQQGQPRPPQLGVSGFGIRLRRRGSAVGWRRRPIHHWAPVPSALQELGEARPRVPCPPDREVQPVRPAPGGCEKGYGSEPPGGLRPDETRLLDAARGYLGGRVGDITRGLGGVGRDPSSTAQRTRAALRVQQPARGGISASH